MTFLLKSFGILGMLAIAVISAAQNLTPPKGWETSTKGHFTIYQSPKAGSGFARIVVGSVKTNSNDADSLFADTVASFLPEGGADRETNTKRVDLGSGFGFKRQDSVGIGNDAFQSVSQAVCLGDKLNVCMYQASNKDAFDKYAVQAQEYRTRWEKAYQYTTSSSSRSGSASAHSQASSTASASSSAIATSSSISHSSQSSSARQTAGQSVNSSSSSSSTDKSGNKSGIPTGLYVAREHSANYNVATGGSEVNDVRHYLLFLPNKSLYAGLPPGPSPVTIDFQRALREEPEKCGKWNLAGDVGRIDWVVDREPTAFTYSKPLDTVVANGLTYYHVEPILNGAWTDEYLYDPFQTIGWSDKGQATALTSGARIRFGKDGKFAEMGLENLGKNPQAINTVPIRDWLTGAYRASGNTLELVYSSGARRSYSCFIDPEPGSSNTLIIGGFPFKKVTR